MDFGSVFVINNGLLYLCIVCILALELKCSFWQIMLIC